MEQNYSKNANKHSRIKKNSNLALLFLALEFPINKKRKMGK